jgi:hypothetical protein
MQPDSITLAAGTGTEAVYSRHAESENRSTYIAPDHSVATRNTLTFYRTEPKTVANYFGTAKVAMKFSKDFTVTLPTGGDGKAPAIAELSVSIPVGVTKENAMALVSRVSDLLSAGTIAEDLISKLEI